MSIINDFDTIYDYTHMWNWGPDWIIVKDIYIAFPDSYSILTPFAYTYLEELIRSTTSEYGVPLLNREGKKNNIKVGIKLVNLAIRENNENEPYVQLLEKAKKYFRYDYFIPGFGIKMNLRSLYILLLKCHHMPAFNI